MPKFGRGRVVLFSQQADDADSIAVTTILRQEATGGILMLAAAVAAIIWASLWPVSYAAAVHYPIGPLDLGHWAADGLLAIFFFVAGLELKRELTVGALSRPADALLPIVAAGCGMVVPALIYLAVNLALPDGQPTGWAIPMATDIAFALAVLAIVGSGLPKSLRAFLLTLAIVDDLGSITVIAIFFSHGIQVGWLLAAIGSAGLWAWLQYRYSRSSGDGSRRFKAYGYLPLGILCWWCLLNSGIHATVAGVVLGLLTSPGGPEATSSRLDDWEHTWRPISAGIAVPLFALFAAGVPISIQRLEATLVNPIGIGIICGLILGKFIGILGGSWLTARLTRAELAPDLHWRDIAGVSLLAGIGFTVSLLIGDLAFENAPELREVAKSGVLIGSVLAALLAAIALRRRAVAHQASDSPDQPGAKSGDI